MTDEMSEEDKKMVALWRKRFRLDLTDMKAYHDEIDINDIPESTDWTWTEVLRGKFFRPQGHAVMAPYLPVSEKDSKIIGALVAEARNNSAGVRTPTLAEKERDIYRDAFPTQEQYLAAAITALKNAQRAGRSGDSRDPRIAAALAALEKSSGNNSA
jgi:hypothetical protein